MMSSYDDTIDRGSTPSAARVGADLRAAREHWGWTLPAIAAHLRIRLVYLEAIEQGRMGDLPGNAYAVGFLRTYAQALGLDPQEIARRFRAEAAEANRETELNFPAPVPERGMPAGAVLLIGALLAIGAYIGWYRMSGDRHAAVEVVQPVPETLAPLIDKTTPPPSGQPHIGTASDMPPPTVPPSSAAAAVPPGGFVPPAPPQSNTMGSSGATVALARPTPPGTDAPKPDTGKPDPAHGDASRITLHARADSWIQVRDKSGQVLLNRVLRNGETWAVPAKTGLLLTTGNAAGTELLVDGSPSATLGGDGAVRRDLPLDPDAIKDGRLAPTAPKHP